jgi:methylenetetrahydrofolate--tRNA-(uracil-5-)-methyltransferase
MTARVQVVGGGLAGCEAAWQLARRGVPVTLFEMRPERRSPAHTTDDLAELVCSNSLRSDAPENAIGLLHEELRRAGSLVLSAADANRVPAGSALAVDRGAFAREIAARIESEPAIELVRREVGELPSGLAILATGPLTSDALAAEIRALCGDSLYFYDSIAPVVYADSLDHERLFRASRWAEPDDGAGDYLNAPFDRDGYHRFVAELVAADKVPLHPFEEPRYFEGCLPIEVMAERGAETLAFGPMKPVGLVDPRTGRTPYAVVQLRQDNIAGDHFSLVGFQTQLKWGDQERVLRLIPGLEQAEFVRFGMVHRNTYVNSPAVLTETWQVRTRPSLFLAGQMSGVEGYVESAAAGLMAGQMAAALVKGEPVVPAPKTTAIGALAYYVSHANPAHYEPSNITFGIMPALGAGSTSSRNKNKLARKLAVADRALADLQAWMHDRTSERVSAVSPA